MNIPIGIAIYIAGLISGLVVMMVVSAGSYNKGYEDGQRNKANSVMEEQENEE